MQMFWLYKCAEHSPYIRILWLIKDDSLLLFSSETSASDLKSLSASTLER